MNKHATVRVHGNAGVGLAENIMSGTVVVDGYAGQSCAARECSASSEKPSSTSSMSNSF